METSDPVTPEFRITVEGEAVADADPAAKVTRAGGAIDSALCFEELVPDRPPTRLKKGLVTGRISAQVIEAGTGMVLGVVLVREGQADFNA